jgi:predicted small secreted protein
MRAVAAVRAPRGTMRRVVLLAVICSLLAGAAGCATFRGMGEDIQNLGKAMKRAIS